MAEHKYIKTRGLSYRIEPITGEVWFETIDDKNAHDMRAWWCLCTDDGEIRCLIEINNGTVPLTDLLLSSMEKADDTRNCYRISFLEYEQARRDINTAQAMSRPQVMDKDNKIIQTGVPRQLPKDMKMLAGERYIEAEVRGRQVRVRVADDKWENAFVIPAKFSDEEGAI